MQSVHRPTRLSCCCKHGRGSQANSRSSLIPGASAPRTSPIRARARPPRRRAPLPPPRKLRRTRFLYLSRGRLARGSLAAARSLTRSTASRFEIRFLQSAVTDCQPPASAARRHEELRLSHPEERVHPLAGAVVAVNGYNAPLRLGDLLAKLLKLWRGRCVRERARPATVRRWSPSMLAASRTPRGGLLRGSSTWGTVRSRSICRPASSMASPSGPSDRRLRSGLDPGYRSRPDRFCDL